MASRVPLEPFLIEVTFSKREDGGLRATSDAVPGFFLSHSDPELVLADVAPALSVILSETFGVAVRVEPLRQLSEMGADFVTVPPAHICAARNFVGMASTH